jgi:hypothetical protein
LISSSFIPPTRRGLAQLVHQRVVRDAHQPAFERAIVLALPALQRVQTGFSHGRCHARQLVDPETGSAAIPVKTGTPGGLY